MNPFRYGKEVSGYQFYDRTENFDQLYRTLKDGSTNVVLYAPRRYGKTSLVLKVQEKFKAEGIKCIHFDISKINNRHRLGSLSTLHSAVRGLLRRGVIDVIRGTYVMADPFFARFVRERSAR